MKIFQFFFKSRVLSKISRRHFAMAPFSFKNKLNLFLKHVHPDILGGECPKIFKEENEKSIQELKQYIDNIESSAPNSNKSLEFNIAVENKITKLTIYKKIEVKLEETKPASENTLKTTNFLK